MKSKTVHSLIIGLIFMVGHLTTVTAVTDAELEALEKQIEQQEAEEKKQAEAKRQSEAKAEVEKRRTVELEKQRREEQRLFEEEKRKLEKEKKKLEQVRQAELERKQQEEEAKRLVLEERKRKEEEAERSIVTLVFFRNQGFPFTGDSALISHNNSQIGSLHSKAFFIYTSPPGKQTFSTVIFKDWTTKKEFEFMPSQTYFIMTAIDFDSVHLTLESVGPQAIKDLKNTGSINPQDVLKNYGTSENSVTNDSSVFDPLKI